MKVIDQRENAFRRAEVGDMVINGMDNDMFLIIRTYDRDEQYALLSLLSIYNMDITYQEETIAELLECVDSPEIIAKERLSITLK